MVCTRPEKQILRQIVIRLVAFLQLNTGKIAVVARNLSPTVPSPSRGPGANGLEAVGARGNRDGRHMQFLSASINGC